MYLGDIKNKRRERKSLKHSNLLFDIFLISYKVYVKIISILKVSISSQNSTFAPWYIYPLDKNFEYFI